MPITRPPYSPEFRRQMVDLVRAGRSSEDLAPEFEPTAQSIGAWVVLALNTRPRKTLGWKTPAEAFDEYLQVAHTTVATIG